MCGSFTGIADRRRTRRSRASDPPRRALSASEGRERRDLPDELCHLQTRRYETGHGDRRLRPARRLHGGVSRRSRPGLRQLRREVLRRGDDVSIAASGEVGVRRGNAGANTAVCRGVTPAAAVAATIGAAQALARIDFGTAGGASGGANAAPGTRKNRPRGEQHAHRRQSCRAGARNDVRQPGSLGHFRCVRSRRVLALGVMMHLEGGVA